MALHASIYMDIYIPTKCGALILFLFLNYVGLIKKNKRKEKEEKKMNKTLYYSPIHQLSY